MRDLQNKGFQCSSKYMSQESMNEYEKSTKEPDTYNVEPQQQAYTATIPTPTDIEAAMDTLSITSPDPNWYMDTGATSHMMSTSGNLTSYFNMSNHRGITIGNGQSIPIRGYGQINLPSPVASLLLVVLCLPLMLVCFCF